MEKVEVQVGAEGLTIETGRLAKQSAGTALVSYGGCAVLVTVNSATPREGIDFFPLTVDYIEKMYASGKMPGGFFKREGALGEKEILTSRFIDRALRPLFPDGYNDDTQVTATVVSADNVYDPDMLAFVGASAAVNLSDIPFPGPIAAVRVARVHGEFVANPTHAQVDDAGCDINVIVAASRDALVMVEGGAKEVPEADVIAALRFGHAAIVPILDAQEELVKRAGKEKRAVHPEETDAELAARIESLAGERIRAAAQITDKKKRYAANDEISKEVLDALVTEYKAKPVSFSTYGEFQDTQAGLGRLVGSAKSILGKLRSSAVRDRILDEGVRIDGRSASDIRPITCEVGVFERLHGSAVFTRGETQALATITLGGSDDEQLIDDLKPKYTRRFMLHYNFPPFSVGEVRMLRGVNRRERGHGALAHRAIEAVLPAPDDCPYTIRIVSEVLESNGSSSMATVCASSLALMQAGIQISEPVAGIAMGLISDGDRYAVLSDILGDEDHLGDMDFKVSGSRNGITAIQMDIKITGLNWEILEKALGQARDGRLHILDRMAEETARELPEFRPSSELSDYAPRVEVLWVKPDRIRDLIGPGGKVIRAIQSATGAKIDIEDSGRVLVLSPDRDRLDRCRSMIEELTQEAEIGRNYRGKVKKVTDFGAFVEIFPGTDGLLHISEMADRRVERVEDICVEGDDVLVKCIDVDPSGKIRLSRRAALAEAEEATTH